MCFHWGKNPKQEKNITVLAARKSFKPLNITENQAGLNNDSFS